MMWIIHFSIPLFTIAILIEGNILKDSNFCFNSLAIRLRSQDLKNLIPGNGVPELQGQHTYTHTRSSFLSLFLYAWTFKEVGHLSNYFTKSLFVFTEDNVFVKLSAMFVLNKKCHLFLYPKMHKIFIQNKTAKILFFYQPSQSLGTNFTSHTLISVQVFY